MLENWSLAPPIPELFDQEIYQFFPSDVIFALVLLKLYCAYTFTILFPPYSRTSIPEQLSQEIHEVFFYHVIFVLILL